MNTKSPSTTRRLAEHDPIRPESTKTSSCFFERRHFQGALARNGTSIPLGFYATIDDLGTLVLELDRIPFSREAYALWVHHRSGRTVAPITLEGKSAVGDVLRSDSFYITRFSHGPESELDFQGNCYTADLELADGAERKSSERVHVWRVRQLRTFRSISHQTPLGRVVIGGPLQDRESQVPNGFIAVYNTNNNSAEGWWAESDRLLVHVARVLSFACDTYLRPVIEERYEPDRVIVRITQQSRVSSPFLAPFYELHMEPIFKCACDSYFTRYNEIEQLDAAIRWLTAPVVYDESRLTNAMTALENILDRCGHIGTFMGSSAFKRLSKEVRELLVSLTAPKGMADKVSELNRRSVREKIIELLTARNIVAHDLPTDWLEKVIQQRNLIVHTGVSGDFGERESDILDHTIWVREIVSRVILERLGFNGAFRSWLHLDAQLYFPECIPMQDWLRRQHPRGQS